MGWRLRIWLTTVYWTTGLVCGQQTALEIGGHPEAGRSANTNCYWRQRFRGLLRCHLELATRYLQICESHHCLRRRLSDTLKLACFIARVSAFGDCLFCAV